MAETFQKLQGPGSSSRGLPLPEESITFKAKLVARRVRMFSRLVPVRLVW